MAWNPLDIFSSTVEVEQLQLLQKPTALTDPVISPLFPEEHIIKRASFEVPEQQPRPEGPSTPDS